MHVIRIHVLSQPLEALGLSRERLDRRSVVRSISEISSCFLGPRPRHIEIRHRVKKTSTINLFGFETLKLKIRRLKLWKPTVVIRAGLLTPTPTASEKPRTAIQLATGHSGSLVNPPGWGWGSKVCPSSKVLLFG